MPFSSCLYIVIIIWKLTDIHSLVYCKVKIATCCVYLFAAVFWILFLWQKELVLKLFFFPPPSDLLNIQLLNADKGCSRIGWGGGHWLNQPVIVALQRKAVRSLSPKDKWLPCFPLEGMFHTFNYPSTLVGPRPIRKSSGNKGLL